MTKIDKSVFSNPQNKSETPLIQDLIKQFTMLQASSVFTSPSNYDFTASVDMLSSKEQEELLHDSKLALNGYLPILAPS